MEIKINTKLQSPDSYEFEVVERKGLGHPDTLADGIAEAVEIAYCKYCLEKYGYIPHHNFDKIIIQGGLFKQEYAAKEFVKPITVVFMGRASKKAEGKEIPLERIQVNAAKSYLKRVLPKLDVDSTSQIIYISKTTDYSRRENWFSPRNISDLPEYSESGPFANDTATMISYWPLTKAEMIALEIEGFFYSLNDKGLPYPRLDMFGQDVKVMVIRQDKEYVVTVAVPVFNFMISDFNEYKKHILKVESEIKKYINIKYPNEKIEIRLNGSQLKSKSSHPYLVTTGSCIDFGEEGAVGRGNKTHGIISSFRPNTMEAPHGKNATYFVGKVLGYLVDIISKNIYDETGIPCQVIMRANIGDYLYNPSSIMVSLSREHDTKTIEDIVRKHLKVGSKTTLEILSSGHFIPNTSAYNEK